jgi:glycosyltransferase involved in cell wall biosynthesis
VRCEDIEGNSLVASVPRISVIMPVYNAAKYLRAAVQSVLDQTYRNFELVVVDDGSRDESLTILKEFAAADPRVKIVSRPNTGIVGALNDGIAAASCDLIARMDSDDLCQPERFEKQIAFMDANADHVLVGSQVMLIDPDNASLCEKRDTEYTHETIDGAHLAHRWPLVHPSILVRKSAIEAVGGYRRKYEWLEDLDLFLRLAEVGKVASLHDVLLRYRLHPDSICHTREADQDKIRPALYAEVYERRGLKPPAEEWVSPSVSNPKLVADMDRNKVWGWWALRGGNVRTARKYALRSVRNTPLASEAWRLMYCAIRGH